MKKGCVLLFLSSLALAQGPIKVPGIEGAYVHVYKPAGDIYPGPDVAGLKAGQFYGTWVANDHCIVKGPDGRWHAFGITHPLMSPDNVHAGENQSFHALAPVGKLTDVVRKGAWKDLPKVLPASERPGEKVENHAPFIVKKAGLYHMIYGPSPIRYATSKDLHAWKPRGKLHRDPGGRDPAICYHNGTYHMLVCGNYKVSMATSRDLINWSAARTVLSMPDKVDPESPSLIRYNKTFYLFVCGWNGVWDKKELSGAYQYITYVYQSDDPFTFDPRRAVTRLTAHAPEIFQDERGDWFISSAEWPHRGISIARLVWK